MPNDGAHHEIHGLRSQIVQNHGVHDQSRGRKDRRENAGVGVRRHGVGSCGRVVHGRKIGGVSRMTRAIQHSSAITEELEHQARVWGQPVIKPGYYVWFRSMWKGPFESPAEAVAAKREWQMEAKYS